MSDIFNPPAIVAPAIVERVAKIKAMNNSISTVERKTVFDIVEMGKELWLLKKDCTERGQWTRALAESGTKQQRASEAMRAAKLPPVVVSKLVTVNDLREALSPRGDEADDMPEPVADDPDAVPGSLDIRKPGQEKWCARCVRLGEQTKDCHACANIAHPPGGKSAPAPPMVYDDKRAWRCLNGFENMAKALVLKHKAKTHALYLATKKSLDDARLSFQQLKDELEAS